MSLCCNFMQALVGIGPGSEAGTAGPKGLTQGAQDRSGVPIPEADGPDPFLKWIERVVGVVRPGTGGNEGLLHVDRSGGKLGDHAPRRPNPIVDGIDMDPTGAIDSQSLLAAIVDDRQQPDQPPPRIRFALNARSDNPWPDDTPFRQTSANLPAASGSPADPSGFEKNRTMVDILTQPVNHSDSAGKNVATSFNMPVADQDPAGLGQDQPGGRTAADRANLAAAGDRTAADRANLAATGDRTAADRTNLAAAADRTATDDGLVIDLQRSESGAEKNRPDAIRVAPGGVAGELNAKLSIQPQSLDEPDSTETGLQRQPLQQRHHLADSTGPMKSVQTAPAAGESIGSEEDAYSHDQPKQPAHGSLHRIRVADGRENLPDGGQASDSSTSSQAESPKTHPFSADPAKAPGAEPSVHAADKQFAGQTAGVNRSDESVTRAFQHTVMDQIVDKAVLRSIQGRSEIQIRLKPEFLGNVQMNIATDKDQLVVRIITDKPMVKEIIENHLHHLKAELQNQGLTIDKFDVTVNPDANQQHGREPFAQPFKQHAFQNNRRQASPQNPDTSDHGEGGAGDHHPRDRDGINYFV